MYVWMEFSRKKENRKKEGGKKRRKKNKKRKGKAREGKGKGKREKTNGIYIQDIQSITRVKVKANI